MRWAISSGSRSADARAVADDVIARFEAGEFDVAHLFYARFQSALVQEPIGRQIIPVATRRERRAGRRRRRRGRL